MFLKIGLKVSVINYNATLKSTSNRDLQSLQYVSKYRVYRKEEDFNASNWKSLATNSLVPKFQVAMPSELSGIVV